MRLLILGGGGGFLVHVIDARRNLVGVCNRWYPVVRHLHRFFYCYC